MTMKSRFNRVADPVGKPKGRERWSWQCVATACALSPRDQVAKAGAAALGRVQCVEVRAFAVSFRLGSPTFFSCASWAEERDARRIGLCRRSAPSRPLKRHYQLAWPPPLPGSQPSPSDGTVQKETAPRWTTSLQAPAQCTGVRWRRSACALQSRPHGLNVGPC